MPCPSCTSDRPVLHVFYAKYSVIYRRVIMAASPMRGEVLSPTVFSRQKNIRRHTAAAKAGGILLPAIIARGVNWPDAAETRECPDLLQWHEGCDLRVPPSDQERRFPQTDGALRGFRPGAVPPRAESGQCPPPFRAESGDGGMRWIQARAARSGHFARAPRPAGHARRRP